MPEPNASVPATQDTGGQPQPQATPQATPAAASGGAPFLQINDRTVYRTQEDAVKGWNELQGSYTKLTPWAEATGRWAKSVDEGGFGLADASPEVVEQLLDELARRRYEEAQAKSASAPKQGDGQLDASKLTPEWQEHVRVLREQAQFVTKEDLESFRAQQEQQRQENAVEVAVKEGQSILAAEVKAAGLEADPDYLEDVFTAIENRITKVSTAGYDKAGNRQIKTGSPEDRFLKGDTAVRQAIIKEYFKPYLDRMEAYNKSKSAAQANAKTQAMGSQPRPLAPAGGQAAPTPGKRLSESELRQGLLAHLAGQSA